MAHFCSTRGCSQRALPQGAQLARGGCLSTGCACILLSGHGTASAIMYHEVCRVLWLEVVQRPARVYGREAQTHCILTGAVSRSQGEMSMWDWRQCCESHFGKIQPAADVNIWRSFWLSQATGSGKERTNETGSFSCWVSWQRGSWIHPSEFTFYDPFLTYNVCACFPKLIFSLGRWVDNACSQLFNFPRETKAWGSGQSDWGCPSLICSLWQFLNSAVTDFKLTTV